MIEFDYIIENPKAKKLVEDYEELQKYFMSCFTSPKEVLNNLTYNFITEEIIKIRLMFEKPRVIISKEEFNSMWLKDDEWYNSK